MKEPNSLSDDIRDKVSGYFPSHLFKFHYCVKVGGNP